MVTCPQCQSDLPDSKTCEVCGWKATNEYSSKERSETVRSHVEEPLGSESEVPLSEPHVSSSQQEPSENTSFEDSPDSTDPAPTIITGSVNIVKEIKSQIQQLTVELDLGEKRSAEDDVDEEWGFHSYTPLGHIPLEFGSQPLSDSTTNLKESNIVLISCFDEEIARRGADALIENLGDIKFEGKQLLLFEKDIENPNLSIYTFLSLGDEIKQRLLVIDAANKAGIGFVDSLLSCTSSQASHIRRELKNNGCFLICLTEPARIDGLQNEGRKIYFPHWRIPFLKYLLQCEYSEHSIELKERIERQQANDKWSRNEEEFYAEIRPYLHNKQLISELDRRESEADEVNIDALFAWDDPIINTLLYAAIFFPNLSPGDFNRVVIKLLADRTMTDRERMPVNGASGLPQKILTEILRNSTKKYFEDSGLKALTTMGRARVVTFPNASLREKLKYFYEDTLFLDVESNFEIVKREGLLFDVSEAVAEDTISLITNLAIDYPTRFKGDWFCDLLLANQEQNRSELLYKRFSALLRRMLGVPSLRAVVNDVFKELVKRREHLSALEIVKRLHFAPDFDGIYWLRQLLDQGGDVTFERISGYLDGLARRQSSNIYELLRRVASWVPEDDRNPSVYSPSNRVALNLMMRYCFKSSFKFEEKNYGLWPSRYPLFALNDSESAREAFAALTHWLFHPGMESIGTPRQGAVKSWSSLLVNWLFILFGSKGSEAKDEGPQHSVSHIPFGTNELFSILLEHVSLRTTVRQQNEMLCYWENLIDSVTKKLASPTRMTGQQRNEYIWQRRYIRKLITELKSMRKRN